MPNGGPGQATYIEVLEARSRVIRSPHPEGPGLQALGQATSDGWRHIPVPINTYRALLVPLTTSLTTRTIMMSGFCFRFILPLSPRSPTIAPRRGSCKDHRRLNLHKIISLHFI